LTAGSARPPFSAEFDCGSSFELAPGDFVGRGCGIIVKGWADTDKRVEVKVTYDTKSGIEIFPGDTSAPPSLMFTPGVTDYYGRYIFSESFRAKDTAPAGTTTVTITVSQEGSGSVTFAVDIAILSKGLLPGSGPGIRPPATVAGGSGGEYCVWRYKMFGDPPPCFHFVAAECGTARYSASGGRYELVGGNMTWGEATARVAQLSSYFDDAYGCRGTGAVVKDADGDGVPDDKDGCPTDPAKTSPGVCGCGVSDRDSDFDGTPDCVDKCPYDLFKTEPGICGCGTSDKDSDGDGVPDCIDLCPGDPNKTKPGECGCREPDVDSDGDGVLDCKDRCPGDPKKTEEGYCGCGRPEKDTDGDGWPDCIDECPGDPYKTDRGVCGCGKPDTDSDGDGTPDCIDKCPKDPAKTEPGLCGCGKPDTDTDGDGTPDCRDKCPKDPNKTEPGKSGCGKPEAGVCLQYDPTNPACEPRAPGGEKHRVDTAQADRLGDDFQRGTGRKPGGTKPGVPRYAAPQPDTYTGKPQEEETCKTDVDCPLGHVCSGGKCVSSAYPPYGPPPGGAGEPGKDWTGWAARPPGPTQPQKQPPATVQPAQPQKLPPVATQPMQPPADTRTVTCSTTAKSGADAPETINVKVGKFAGTAKFYYNMYTVKDRMIVQYGGRTLLDTGCVSGSKTVQLSLTGVSDAVTVIVQPACEKKGTKWDFRLECPK
jgi:hypothetical protein